MSKARKLKPEDVVFTLTPEPQDDVAPFHDADCCTEEERLELQRRLDYGDLWAWCCVKVSASISCVVKRAGYVDQIVTLTGTDYLGGCSYKNEADFRADCYFEEMQRAALADLQAQIDAIAEMVVQS